MAAMFQIFDIINNFKDNQRHICDDLSIEISDKYHYQNIYREARLFRGSKDTELGNVYQFMLLPCPLYTDCYALDIDCGRRERIFALAKIGLNSKVRIALSPYAVDLAIKTGLPPKFLMKMLP